MVGSRKIHIAVYFLGVCPGSIALLVFINATISFVITDIIRQRIGVGDATGSLGFADELVAIIFCPIWGLVSDRVGIRNVSPSYSSQSSILEPAMVHHLYPQGRRHTTINGTLAVEYSIVHKVDGRQDIGGPKMTVNAK